MLILLNEKAADGTAFSKYTSIESKIRSRSNEKGEEITLMKCTRGWEKRTISRIRDGEKKLVIAGGDGTINSVMDLLMNLSFDQRDGIKIGGIGLGSANDFFKPSGVEASMDGIPTLLDFDSTRPHNIVHLRLFNIDNGWRDRYISVNAGIGIIAKGNDLFNRNTAVMRALKRISMPLAVNYCSVRPILSDRPVRYEMVMDGEKKSLVLSNLSIVMNPHHSGIFKYDTPVNAYSDHFCLNVFGSMPLARRMRTFIRFQKGEFTRLEGARWWKVRNIEIVSDEPQLIEIDGEVDHFTRLTAELIKGAFFICSK